MIDIDALKRDKRPQSSTLVHALIDLLEAAEKELAELRSSMKFRTSLIGRTEAEREALRSKIEAMEKQEPVAWARKLGLDVPSFGCVTDLKYRPSNIPESSYIPLYTLPGAQPAPSLASNNVSLISEGKTQPAQSVKDAIIDDLQSQFDTEGITEHDSGDALIRLSDAIAAVEDNFAQPAPSICPAALSPIINWLRNGCDPRKAADELEMLAAAPETKP